MPYAWNVKFTYMSMTKQEIVEGFVNMVSHTGVCLQVLHMWLLG